MSEWCFEIKLLAPTEGSGWAYEVASIELYR